MTRTKKTTYNIDGFTYRLIDKSESYKYKDSELFNIDGLLYAINDESTKSKGNLYCVTVPVHVMVIAANESEAEDFVRCSGNVDWDQEVVNEDVFVEHIKTKDQIPESWMGQSPYDTVNYGLFNEFCCEELVGEES